MSKLFLFLAALSGFLSVAFGAFGAHALKQRLDAYALGVFETAVQYQFLHTLALLAVAILALWQPLSPWLKGSGYLFCFGIVVFSGSLYLLSLTGVKWLGAITPIGGLGFLGGWLCLAVAALQLSDRQL